LRRIDSYLYVLSFLKVLLAYTWMNSSGDSLNSIEINSFSGLQVDSGIIISSIEVSQNTKIETNIYADIPTTDLH
jgi:hypothetical protein